MGALIRATDWSKTAIGPPSSWPQTLRTTVSLCLAAELPMAVVWGPQATQIYNDAYRRYVGSAHPEALGGSFRKTWERAWHAIGEPFERAARGDACHLENRPMFLDRSGYPEEVFFTFSLSPIRDERGQVGGVLHTLVETTAARLDARRTRALRDLTAALGQAGGEDEFPGKVVEVLSRFERDLPFVAIYRREAGYALIAHCGLRTDPVADGATGGAATEDAWPVAPAQAGSQSVEADALPAALRARVEGVYAEPPSRARIIPVNAPGEDPPPFVVVVGASPRLPMNEDYLSFYEMLDAALSQEFAAIRARERERQRADALAETDRVRTTFFSNVSHEFRTPLTLILGPLEAILARRSTAGEDQRDLVVVRRSALRLLKLVNSLLDFCRAEADRLQASYEPVELATFTARIASNFGPACDSVGLRLRVDSPPLAERVHVDREMWEKIVLNLVSNAFKFTLAGEISVAVRREGEDAVVEVLDTGIGIAPSELPRIFERFYQVETARGRTREGSGIGLALVRDLVSLHGGSIGVESTPGEGTTFTLRLPFGTAHLPSDRIAPERGLASTPTQPEPFVEEALGWIPGAGRPLPAEASGVPAAEEVAPGGPTRILVADDSADMRTYLSELLSSSYEVDVVGNGAEALAAVRRRRPDLVLADVMMPKLDGLALVRKLRSRAETRDVPVILVSARAGDEAAGLDAGADDYLVKPFGARDLTSRVDAHLYLSRIRREDVRVIRESEVRQRHLLELNDALLAISDPVETMRVASAVLGRHLDAPQVAYAEVEADGEHVVVEADWTDGSVPCSAGRCSLRAFSGPFLVELARGEAVAVDDVRTDPRTSASSVAERFDERSIRAVLNVPLVKGGRLVAVLAVHCREPRSWSKLDLALVTETVDRTWAAVERARTECRLSDSERHQRALIEGIPQLIWRAKAGGRLTWSSPQWSAFTGLSADESRGRGWLAAIHPDDRTIAKKAWRDAGSDKPLESEMRIYHAAEGRYRWCRSRATPVRDEAGQSVEWFGTSTDVDQLKQLQEHQRILVAELQHRTRNLIAVVQAIAGQALRASRSPEDFKERFDDRLAALSRVQGLLSRSNVAPIHFRDILRLEIEALDLDTTGSRLQIDGPDVLVRSSVVQTLSLALHELAVNARKHGALSSGGGRLSVTWECVRDDGGAPWLRIDWSELGIKGERESGSPPTMGYGRTLLERALPHSVGARTSFDLGDAALHCVIELPLQRSA